MSTLVITPLALWRGVGGEALPLCFRLTCLDKRCLLVRLFAEERLDERLAHPLGDAQLENHILQRLLHLAVSRSEERVVARAAVLGVGTEVACAVILRYHATLLTGTVTTAHDVLSRLKPARVDVDVTVLIEHCLCLHLEILDKYVLLFAFQAKILTLGRVQTRLTLLSLNRIFHCTELIAREVFEKGAYIIADAQLIPSTSTQVRNYLFSFTMSVAKIS